MRVSIVKYSIGVLIGCMSYGQNIYVETSLSSASFDDFKNDDGVNTLDNKYSKAVELGIGAGVIFNITNNNRLKWDMGINYNKYKVNTSFNYLSTSTPTEYNLNYVSFKTGPYFTLITSPRIKFQIHTHSSIDYLISGSNEYNDVYVDLSEGNQFSKLVMNYHYGATVEVVLSASNSLYVSYDSKNGLTNNIENDQTYRLNATSIIMGFRFKLTNSKKE